MAIPPDALTYARQFKITGVGLKITASTAPDVPVEIWSRTSSQSSSLLRTIQRLGGNSETVLAIHRLPLDGRKRYYKFRNVPLGQAPSAFSTEISIKPTLLSPSALA